MQLGVRVHQVGETVVIALEGVVDLGSVPALQDRLHRTVLDHPSAVVAVDLDATLGLDDCALGVLLGAAARARDAGGDLVVVCSTPALRQRLSSTRFDHAVTVRATLG